jgi:predicted DNA-binding protein (UPF0251 family)
VRFCWRRSRVRGLTMMQRPILLLRNTAAKCRIRRADITLLVASHKPMTNPWISHAKFTELLSRHRLRGAKTIAAVRYVLVDGLSQYAAAKKVGIAESAVSRALARLRAPTCPHCGQPLKG